MVERAQLWGTRRLVEWSSGNQADKQSGISLDHYVTRQTRNVP